MSGNEPLASEDRQKGKAVLFLLKHRMPEIKNLYDFHV